ncbi:MAG: carbamoyl-phosphate synthase large subunit, partial [Pirellula sp.]
LRGLEVGAFGFGSDSKDLWYTERRPDDEEIRNKLSRPNADRVWYLRYALLSGMSIEEIYAITAIDPWFLDQLEQIVEMENSLRRTASLNLASTDQVRQAKQMGFSDRQLATLLSSDDEEIRAWRLSRGIKATYKSVDTCAAEFEAYTPYYYSTYESEDETPLKAAGKKRVMILGGGPNRFGQGIEFDYCCCHASYALRQIGIESIMVNSNPETVSTDYDTSDLLFFEPLTTEDVLNIYDRMQPDGVIVQFGGQTPLNLARALADAGVPIVGTSVETIEDAEDREKFQKLIHELSLKQPANGIARTMEQARAEVQKIGFPCLVRPSFVLGGRAMEICYDHTQFERFVAEAFVVAQGQPVLIDRFLEDAIEVDVDAVSDGQDVVIMGVMEHIEEAGVHSGDSACVIPSFTLSQEVLAEIRRATTAMAQRLRVVGLMNVQFAIKKEDDGAQHVYVLEVNPRASRTVP